MVDITSLQHLAHDCSCPFLIATVFGSSLAYALTNSQGHLSGTPVILGSHNGVDYHSARHLVAHNCCCDNVAVRPVLLLWPRPVEHSAVLAGCIHNWPYCELWTGTMHTLVCR